jgi:hypothetical protein
MTFWWTKRFDEFLCRKTCRAGSVSLRFDKVRDKVRDKETVATVWTLQQMRDLKPVNSIAVSCAATGDGSRSG